MKELTEIRNWYPEELHDQPIFLLREYLQYEILKIIFKSKYADKYTFLGGTCLRVAYNTDRFSEDLDFDNVGLTKEQFEDTSDIIKYQLELLGFRVRLKFAYKGAFHCNITFPALLYDYKLSGHKEAKLLIKLDTEKQGFEFERQLYRLDKFGIDTDILVTPLSLLASQKIAAIMGRKRAKGRDFYDLTHILRQTTPDYAYLEDRFDVTDAEALRTMVNERIAPFSFEQLATDVAPFLFNREDLKMVLKFPEFWKTVELGES